MACLVVVQLGVVIGGLEGDSEALLMCLKCEKLYRAVLKLQVADLVKKSINFLLNKNNNVIKHAKPKMAETFFVSN